MPTYEPIATQLLTDDNSNTVDFNSIPASYTHLRFVATLRQPSGNNGVLQLRLNGDSNTRYSVSFGTQTYNSSVTTHNNYENSQSVLWIPFGSTNYPIPATGTAGKYATFIWDLPNYRSGILSKAMLFRYLNPTTDGSTGFLAIGSGRYDSSSAITSATFTKSSANFASGTQFTLFGLLQA